MIYEGDYKNSKYEGVGKFIFSNGYYYLGEFKNGNKEGNGIIFDTHDNLIFEGEFKKGLLNVKGKLYQNNILIYDGIFLDNYFLKGTLLLDNNNYYKGTFKGFEFDGKGKIIDKNGELIYEGDFVNSEYEGRGKLILEIGFYEGEFKNSLPNGKGEYHDRIGKLIYDGDVVNGIFEGYGTMHYNDGRYYIGYFENGKQKGQGVLYDKDGNTLYEGYFDGITDPKKSSCFIF